MGTPPSFLPFLQRGIIFVCFLGGKNSSKIRPTLKEKTILLEKQELVSLSILRFKVLVSSIQSVWNLPKP